MPTIKHRRRPQRQRTTRRSAQPTSAALLLEIGTEELPYQFISPALRELAGSTEALLREKRLSYGTIHVFGTPRRLAVMVEEIPAKQAAARQEIMGPPKTVAFTKDGQPTQAAQGFAKSQGISAKELEIRETSKGAYLCAVKQDDGRATDELLGEHLPRVIQDLSFSKSMQWDETRMRFARPIRWLVALYGKRVIPIELAGVRSGSRTWGHRFLKGARTVPMSKGVEIKTPESYLKTLEQAAVYADQEQRRSIIQAQLASLAKSAKGEVYQENQDELLEQAVFTLEWPHAILGRFNPDYLRLPQDVLITAMKEHQGYFSLVDRDGLLLPRFITVTNMELADMDLIRTGHERVLAARLADAQYFFDEDRKTKLTARVDQLKGVVFHQKLGSLYQKTERIMSLIVSLAEAMGLQEFNDSCQRAALLSKADLTTGMVGEFPILQGIMGEEYAGREGESEDVSLALGEQYLPRSIDESIPQTVVGKLLSLADRLDTLTAFFRMGILPSGSEDPFGLRRHALGVVRIIIESQLKVNVLDLVDSADRLLELQGVVSANGINKEGKVVTQGKLLEFLTDRLRYYGRTMHGLRDDVMEAVLAARREDEYELQDLFSRMHALQAITRQSEFDPLMVGFKRAHHLVEKEQWTQAQIDQAILEHPTERVLFKGVTEAQDSIPLFIANRDYSAALDAFIRMKPAIDDFFTGVLVNTDNAAIRANRLSLLYAVDQLFLSFADFSRIQVGGS